jgi:transcriptional regulator with XRE-family HTH domain
MLVAEERQKGVNQKDIARAAGISQAALVNYMGGRLPGVEQLSRLAKYFKTSPDHLLGWPERGSGCGPAALAGVIAESESGGIQRQQKLFGQLIIVCTQLTISLCAAETAILESKRSLAIITKECERVVPNSKRLSEQQRAAKQAEVKLDDGRLKS